MLNAACPLLKLKEGPVLVKKKKKNRMFGLRFFLQVKYETWVGFRLQKPNTNEDSFVPFKP